MAKRKKKKKSKWLQLLSFWYHPDICSWGIASHRLCPAVTEHGNGANTGPCLQDGGLLNGLLCFEDSPWTPVGLFKTVMQSETPPTQLILLPSSFLHKCQTSGVVSRSPSLLRLSFIFHRCVSAIYLLRI